MTFNLGLPEISVIVLALGAVQFLASLLISERLKVSLQKEHSKFLEDLRWDLKVREQAVRVAEYMALAKSLKGDSPESDYRKANQLSWELAMWLPEQIYKEMTRAIASPTIEANPLTTVVAVRSLLLGTKAGNLTSDHIAHHGPGIAKLARTNQADSAARS